ncbi:MAG: phospholipase D-like domain-containing protein [Fibrobacterales bacterium]
MSYSARSFKLYLGPKEQSGPDSLLEPIIGFIDDAKPRENLCVALQEIDNREITEALIRARSRGVVIDIVLEQSYLLASRKQVSPFEPSGSHEINRELFSALYRADIDVKVDFNSAIFHQKFMTCSDSVLTGSTNFTDTGVTKNLNHVIVIHNKTIANQFRIEFDEIKSGRFGRESIMKSVAPINSTVDRIRIRVLFSPDHTPELEIMKQILKARVRIDFAVFTFAHSSGIDDALIAAQQRGVQITGVLDRLQGNQKWAATHNLVEAGISISLIGNKGGLGKLHHKLMVIDDAVTIFGSFNYTEPANRTNDENIVIVGDVFEDNTVARERQREVAVACREEIERIITLG